MPHFETKLSDCRSVVLREQGHSVLVERTEETKELILEWVQDHALVSP